MIWESGDQVFPGSLGFAGLTSKNCVKNGKRTKRVMNFMASFGEKEKKLMEKRLSEWSFYDVQLRMALLSEQK